MAEDSSSKGLEEQKEKRELSSPSERQFGPAEIEAMNHDLPDGEITLFLAPEFDKRLLPIKANQLRNWWEQDEKTRMHARFCLPLTMASGLGFYILSPATFTVEWSGQENQDCVITVLEASSHAVIDNHSSFGSFTVQTRFVARTKKLGDFVYVKGVANQPRQPFHVLEAMIESWWSPSEFGVVCLMNQPGKFTIKKGEPIAQMFVVNAQQAQYRVGTRAGDPPLWKEWKQRRDPSIYNGRNMDYLRGVLPDQTPVCPHMKSWTKNSEDGVTAPSETSVAALLKSAHLSIQTGNFDEAERSCLEAARLAQSNNDINDDLLTNLSSTSYELQNFGKYPGSIRLMRKWIELKEKFSPGSVAEIAEALTDVAWTLRELGEFEQGAESLRESLKRKREQNIGGKALARTLIALGTLLDSIGLRVEAKPYLTEARQIYAKTVSEDDPDNLYLKNVYACLLSHMGEFEEAEALYAEVIRERSKLFGADSSEVALTHNDLGHHYKAKKNWDRSEENFLKCIEIRERILGADNLEMATAHNDLAWMYQEQGDLKKAIERTEIIVAIRKKKLYPNDAMLRGSYATLVDLYNRVGDHAASNNAKKALGD